jgi:AcrR family transcriptional regulator
VLVEQLRSRGRPALISREQIVDAAAEIGLDGLTMGSVAERLGVTTPALYSHVSGREELAGLVVARLIGQFDAAFHAETDWRAFLHSFARTVRDGLAGSRWAAIGQMREASAVAAGLAEQSLSVLIGAGFTPRDAAEALWLVVRVALTAGPATAPSLQDQRLMAPELVDPPAELVHLRTVTAEMNRRAENDTFASDLEVVLDGLAVRLARTRDVKGAAGDVN